MIRESVFAAFRREGRMDGRKEGKKRKGEV